MGNTTKHAITLTLLYIVITSISLPPNNAQVEIHFSSHLLPSTTQPPSHAPAPSPHHHHNHHHYHHRHAFAPASAPSFASASPPPRHSKPVTASPPAKAPISHSPLGKPVHPPSAGPVPVGKRKFVAVQGLVYCKMNCTFSGVNTLLGASPLAGARVVLRCQNTQYLLRKTATTDTNGYFFLQAPPLLTTYGAHKCKVYLAHHMNTTTSATGACTKATNMNNGATGAYLYSNNTGPPSPLPSFSLFSVGPFAYESSKCGKVHH